MCKKLICLFSVVFTLGLAGSVVNAVSFYQDDVPDGILSMEAENFDRNTPQGIHRWEFVMEPTGFSGTGAMRALPDTGDLIINEPEQYLTICPRLDYEVKFIRSGRHYIWVRWYAISNETNSCHVGINGNHNPTSDRAGNVFTYFQWLWASDTELDQYERLTMDIPSPGEYTINVWMREDGYWFDKIVFTTNPDYTPTGEGPPESSRGPRTKAYAPTPKNGEIDTTVWVNLSWFPSPTTVSHDVYLGTDINDVTEATRDNPLDVLVSQNQDNLTYGYWRVDEVNDAEPNSPWKGDVWSFTTANYIVIEDFEDYNDFSPDEIWNTWIDGFGDPANGSTAGYPAPNFFAGEHYMEDEIIHGGNWSMPVFYDNSEAGLSEVTRTFNADWTQNEVVTLTLWYYGDADNVAEPMYVALNGNAVVTNDDPKAALDNEWNQWDILLQDFADQGVNLTNVNTMSIGFGNKANPQAGGGTGHVFFDDIRLYRSLPEEAEPEPEPVDPGTDNLVAYYAFENNTQDGSGNGYNATTSGNPQYVEGLTGYGMAMELDGTGDYVKLPIGSAIAEMSDITVATWANFSNLGGDWQRIFDFGSGEEVYMFVTPRMTAFGSMRFAIMTEDVAEISITAPTKLPSSWHHVAASIDSASMTMKLYQDGKIVAEGETSVLPSDLGQTTQNWLGRSQFVADAYYFGSLDEFRIYNRALSDAEIRYLAGK